MPVILTRIIDGKPVVSGDFTCSFELREGAAFAEVPSLRRPRAQNPGRKRGLARVGMIGEKSSFPKPPKYGGLGMTPPKRKKRPAPVGMIAGKSRFLTPPKYG